MVSEEICVVTINLNSNFVLLSNPEKGISLYFLEHSRRKKISLVGLFASQLFFLMNMFL